MIIRENFNKLHDFENKKFDFLSLSNIFENGLWIWFVEPRAWLTVIYFNSHKFTQIALYWIYIIGVYNGQFLLEMKYFRIYSWFPGSTKISDNWNHTGDISFEVYLMTCHNSIHIKINIHYLCVYCKSYTIQYCIHNIYRPFTGWHQIICYHNFLWAIIAEFFFF